MAIRFTPEYNKRINDVVARYNRRLERANTEGKIKKSMLPEKASVKTLKKSYQSRAELDRELENLENFRRKSARASVSDYVTKYDLSLIKKNRRAAIEHFEKQADIIRHKANLNYPLQKARLKTLERNIDILKKGPEGATTAELDTMSAYIDKYRKSFERRATGYRGFMSEVEFVMDKVGVTKAEKDAFFAKFSKLNPEEFYELWEKSDLVGRVYELADSPKYKGRLTSTRSDARELIDELMQQADQLIADVKSK